MKHQDREWTVYIARCADGKLYTGITLNLQERIKCHNNGTGAKYTLPSVKRPLVVVHREVHNGVGAAMRRELYIKRLSRKQKLELIKNADPSNDKT